MPTVQKRRFRRITAIQTAALVSRSSGTLAGEIRDFSPGGLLFALTQPVYANSLQNQFVTIEFGPVLTGTERYRIVGRVVRIFDLSIGIALENFPADAYRDLIRLTQQPQQKATSEGFQSNNPQIASALAKCHSQFKSCITQVIAHFYNSLEGKLAFSASQAGTLEERWLLHNAYPLVVAQRSKIEQGFVDDNYLSKGVQDRTTAKVNDKPTLSLVDEDEFDDWLAVSQLVNRLNLEHSYEIGRFESRYEGLTGKPFKTNANPFGPHYIFQTFREVLAKNEYKNQIKALLYKTFYESLLVFITQLYRDLNETLAFVPVPKIKAVPPSPSSEKHTATPNTRNLDMGRASAVSTDDYLQTGKTQPPPAAREQPAPYAAPVFTSSGNVQQANQRATQEYSLSQLLQSLHLFQNEGRTEQDYRVMSENLRALPDAPVQPSGSEQLIPAMHELLNAAGLGQGRPGGGASGQGAAGVAGNAISGIKLGDILGALNLIQQQRANNGKDVDESSIKRQLIEAMPQFSQVATQNRFSQSINLFDEMLSSPLSDDTPNSDIRSLLKKIELTLLKLALMDENFLKSSDHPAQQTVNLIERFYAAADDKGKLFDPRLQRLLTLLANQIVDQFESKPGVFDDVNKVLSNLLLPIEETRKKKVAQIKLACEQREARSTAQSVDNNALGEDNGEASGINLLRPGNWLSVMVESTLVPYQLVWLSRSGNLFVLTSRSATTVRELSRKSLFQGLVTGQVVRLLEYDIPFMERSAHKIMLNAYERVYQHATHDEGSGLLNRKGMIMRLDMVFANEDVKKRNAILCMMMFDQLSLLYHNCDSQEAEASLMSLIGVIAKEIKPTDVFARLGESTFALLLHDSDLAVALTTMQTMVSTIEYQRISCQGKQFAVGVNVGIAQISEDINTVPKLLRCVGSACVAAKANGVNSVQLYEADSEQIRHEQSMFEWAGALDQVINDNLLFLRCQRIQPIDKRYMRLPHYEILLGIDKKLQTNPQEFVLAAEKWNRSADIDLWVLQRSFEWLKSQGDKLDAIGGISINLSGHSLANKKILSYIRHALQTQQIPANKIIFEITETAVISRMGIAQRFIEAVRQLGCRFSLDDFGSGYSSFAYLKNLNVDYLKIDGTFIRDLAKSSTDYAMVKSMHQVGHALGLKTIAEYVESPAILEKLSEIGVDYAQGYGVELSKPLSTLML